ncbi:hypothetical protein F5X97DRAFT_196205 [Nemania serpens]|nr:hypothetical protein F5X97DRAFT_196205 [Nemania serpens]
MRPENACDDNIDAGAPGPELRGPPGHLPLYSSRTRHFSWPQSHRVARRLGFRVSPSHDALNPFEEEVLQLGQRPISEPISRPANNESPGITAATPITSFPRLISRSCTNDWLTPLGLCDHMGNAETGGDQLSEYQEIISDLYNNGVDAHSRACIYNPLPILEEDSQTTSTSPGFSLSQDYRSPIREYENQWPSQAEEGDENYGRKLGCSIGVASHKRINSAREPHRQRTDVNENFLDRLRHYSLMPLPYERAELVHRERSVQPPLTETPPGTDKGRKGSSRELLQQILYRSAPSSTRSSLSKFLPRVLYDT